MAGGSLLALLDDIASLLDDVAILAKVAARKGAAVLGDDLALNAQQVTGLTAARELPVVWAVARGSLLNKLILVPSALAIGALLPWAITPLLMIGGAYLCYEGFEKLAHRFLHAKEATAIARSARLAAVADPGIDLVAFERDKIKGAIRTDFILSAEIIAITLGTVAAASLLTQALVLSMIAFGMTVVVYGLVAGIVKIDDVALYLSQAPGAGGWRAAKRWMGAGLLWMAPRLMKTLSVVGTAAMFLVGGAILTHGVPMLYRWIGDVAAAATGTPGVGALLGWFVPLLGNALVGIVAGALILVVVLALRRATGGPTAHG